MIGVNCITNTRQICLQSSPFYKRNNTGTTLPSKTATTIYLFINTPAQNGSVNVSATLQVYHGIK